MDDHAERGASSVLGAAIMAVILLVAAAGLCLGGVLVATHRARAAADLAALAAAAPPRDSPQVGDPCGVAARVAEANGATLVACSRRGADVVVEVGVPTPSLLGLLPDARGRARAGPPRGATPAAPAAALSASLSAAPSASPG